MLRGFRVPKVIGELRVLGDKGSLAARYGVDEVAVAVKYSTGRSGAADSVIFRQKIVGAPASFSTVAEHTFANKVVYVTQCSVL